MKVWIILIFGQLQRYNSSKDSQHHKRLVCNLNHIQVQLLALLVVVEVEVGEEVVVVVVEGVVVEVQLRKQYMELLVVDKQEQHMGVMEEDKMVDKPVQLVKLVHMVE